MNPETRSEPASHQDLQPEQPPVPSAEQNAAVTSSLQLQLETRERLVRLEEENRHLRERVTELNDKQKRLRQSLDDDRMASQQQLNDRAGKLGSRIDTLSRRLDRLFSFWMISTMLLMLFAVAIMFKAGH